MHASNLPLTTWFWAAYLMATHSNGISGLQLQKQLGLGSYSTAWLLLGKLRPATVDPDRNPLSVLVEIDETSIRHRTGNGAVGRGRSHKGKLMIVGAVETETRDEKSYPRRIRLSEISDYTAQTLGRFVESEVAGGCGSSPAVLPSRRGVIIGRQKRVTFESNLTQRHRPVCGTCRPLPRTIDFFRLNEQKTDGR